MDYYTLLLFIFILLWFNEYRVEWKRRDFWVEDWCLLSDVVLFLLFGDLILVVIQTGMDGLSLGSR